MLIDNEIWNLVLKTVLNNKYTSLKSEEIEDELYLTLNRKLPVYLEKAHNVEAIKTKLGYQYNISFNFVWSFLRAASNVLIYSNDFPKLKILATYLIDGYYRGLIKYILNTFDFKAEYDNIRINDEKICFSRVILWVATNEKERKLTILPGLEYEYSPNSKGVSVSISFNCQFLWNWLFEIKYLKPSDLLDVSVFKSVESIIGVETFKDSI